MLSVFGYFHQSLGQLEVDISDEKIISLRFVNSKQADTSLLIHKLLNHYFDHKKDIDYPLLLVGTPFQKRVWRALLQIPFGQTMTYGGLAKKLNTSSRAIGQACRANPIPIIIPCHRVVAANGVGGYAGYTCGTVFEKKLWLLNHEQAI